MISIAKHKKPFSFLLMLTYLLVGIGLGNALLLCQEAGAFSHLELNLSGSCESICAPGQKNILSDETENLSFRAQETPSDCLDSQVSFAHASASPPENIGKTDYSYPAWQIFSNHLAQPLVVNRFVKQNLVAQPPPSQTLLALRTIVLLH